MGWLLARLRAGPSAGYRKRELGQSGSSRPAPLWSSLTARGSRSLAEPYVGRVWPRPERPERPERPAICRS